MEKLPKKLSELLRLAVKDCQAVEKIPELKLNMDFYHEPLQNGAECSVCMAGAVMDQTLKVARDVDAEPNDFDSETGNCLDAINSMRHGNFIDALDLSVFNGKYWNKKLPIIDTQIKTLKAVGAFIEDNFCYELERAEWKDYLEAAQRLEDAGL